MSKFNYDSYCGFYCGACSILQAYRDGSRDAFARFWEEETPLELKCYGCKSDQLFENCAVCEIRKCAIEKGAERCLACAEFPCKRLQNIELFEMAKKKLPHMGIMVENVQRIAEVGSEAWLAEQEERWTCPECGNVFSWYVETCTRCGHDVGSRRGFSGMFDSSIFDYLKKK